MTRGEAAAALERALEISRALETLADRGDVKAAARLDAERRHLLESARDALETLDEEHRRVLREIAALNDRSLGLLEHRLRAKCRDLDMLSVGRRAVRAYGRTRA